MQKMILIPILAGLAMSAHAQTSTVVPAKYTTTEANSSTGYPFGLGGPARCQYLYDTSLTYPAADERRGSGHPGQFVTFDSKLTRLVSQSIKTVPGGGKPAGGPRAVPGVDPEGLPVAVVALVSGRRGQCHPLPTPGLPVLFRG